jgi:hypothetical protein
MWQEEVTRKMKSTLNMFDIMRIAYSPLTAKVLLSVGAYEKP